MINKKTNTIIKLNNIVEIQLLYISLKGKTKGEIKNGRKQYVRRRGTKQHSNIK